MLKGDKFYNNGTDEIILHKGEFVPDGFVEGRLKSKVKAIQDKTKQTNLQRYGVEYSLQSVEVRDKAKQASLQKFGAENPMQSEEIKQKAQETNLQYYGVRHPAQSEEVKEKTRQTNQERYGTDTPFQAEEVKAKIRQTNLQRYGAEVISQSPEIQARIQQTNLQRYGVENPSQAESVKQKKHETCILHYGVENPSQSQEVQRRKSQTSFIHYGTEFPSQSEEFKRSVIETCEERYGVKWPCMRPDIKSHSNNSGPNAGFAKLLDVAGIDYQREVPVGKYSFDFQVGDNILIEIDPFPFHNSLWSPFGEGVAEDYHLKKTLAAEGVGKRCIHVFDWDDVHKIVSLLKHRHRIYARSCSLREVSEAECREFLNLYHLQNTCKGQAVRLGLYEANTLVSVMTFGFPRYSKLYEWELLRYCSIKSVTGGAERLFKHFIAEQNPKSIISYCDRSKFRGSIYLRLGFQVKSVGSPSKHWYSPKEKRHITDNLLRQRGYDQLFHESYGKGTSNEELIIARGYVPIYDCGQDSYVWLSG